MDGLVCYIDAGNRPVRGTKASAGYSSSRCLPPLGARLASNSNSDSLIPWNPCIKHSTVSSGANPIAVYTLLYPYTTTEGTTNAHVTTRIGTSPGYVKLQVMSGFASLDAELAVSLSKTQVLYNIISMPSSAD